MARLLILLLSLSFTQFCNAQNKFELLGQVNGFADSTVIYLDTNNAAKGIVNWDSTVIIRDRFQFAGSMRNPVTQVLLRTKNFQDYRFIWIENSVIRFTGTKGKFKAGKVTGSKTQMEQDVFDSTAGSDRNKSVSFIQHHPNSTVSAYILSVYATSWGKDTTSMLYNALSKDAKNTSYGKEASDYLTLNKNPKIGDRYVDFTQKNTQGKNVSLSDFKGKVVLLDFWGSWCGPCRKNNGELVKIYNEYKDKGFEILGVAADGDSAQWLGAIKKDGLTWENVTDFNGPKNKAAIIYGIYKFPTNYLIDQSGTLIAMDLYGDDLRTKLRSMLDGN
jgi:peroxiredoxin